MNRTAALLTLGACCCAASLAVAQDSVPRMPNGKPDLSGTYDIKTLTPLQRPTEFADNLYLTPEQARKIMDDKQDYIAKRAAVSDPDRDAPAAGGAPPAGLGEEFIGRSGAGAVGGYNNFWIDDGDTVVMVDGKFRTSILTEPANGRRPGRTPEAQSRLRTLFANFRGPEDRAFWLEREGPGPFDGPESRTLADRCLTSFSSTVPALPTLYNNTKRIVQTDTKVMLLNEMVHDARVVHIGGEHPPADVVYWFGHSIGHWEGDTLVVDTTNFRDNSTSFGGSTPTLRVVEKLTRKDADTLHYAFEVHDSSVWSAPWKGDFTWPITDGKVYEYACHEGNYAMPGILKGARVLEGDFRKEQASGN